MIEDTHREVRVAGDDRAVLMRRSYDAPIDDVWDACTNAERIPRWFLPISGDLRLGGSYQLEGNAGGEIVRCEPPRLLRVTWVFGGGSSEVELRLSTAANGETQLELEHDGIYVPEHWDQFGPGAVGVGWDLGLHSLDAHLRGEPLGAGWETSPEGKEFATGSSEAWGAANEAAGAPAAEATAMAASTTRFYTQAPDA